MFEHLGFQAGPALHMTALGVVLGFVLLEYGLSRLARHDTYDYAETAASFGVALGHKIVRVIEAGLVAIPFTFAYQHRLFDIAPDKINAILALFLATEFIYYWHHRASHRVRWLWANHAVHHSAARLNLSAAIRLGWTGNISGHFLFFLPLAWIGFHPLAIVAMLGVNLAYQFFIHTELVRHLGPLEWALNTPAHHRVHHAANRDCLDKNYGGVLIIFDRLFGTFAQAPKTEPLRYGLVGRPPSLNPFRIVLDEWISLYRDARRATTFQARLNVLFGPPGGVHQEQKSTK